MATIVMPRRLSLMRVMRGVLYAKISSKSKLKRSSNAEAQRSSGPHAIEATAPAREDVMMEGERATVQAQSW